LWDPDIDIRERAERDVFRANRFADSRVAQCPALYGTFVSIAGVSVTPFTGVASHFGDAWAQPGENPEQRLDTDALRVRMPLVGLTVKVTAVVDFRTL
jgi:hypothetical protein